MVVASFVEAGLASPGKGMDDKPRIIGAEVKHNSSVIHHDKPHIAGELDLLGETTSEPHWVEVKDGQLVVYPGCGPQSSPIWRLPLRHLNLQPAASGRPRGFSLSRHGETVPIATFQVGSELEYERWVKTLAAELMRQTPLEAVRFLDILGITATIQHRASPSRELEDRIPHRSFSPDYHSDPECRSWLRCSPTLECCTRNGLSPSRQMERMYQQPLSLIVTNEPTKSVVPRGIVSSGCLTYGQLDTVDARSVKVPSARNIRLSLSNRDAVRPRGVYDRASFRDDAKSARPPLPDVVKDLPPCERRSRTRTRLSDGVRVRGKSADIWQHGSEPENGYEAVAGLIARCQQVDKYVPVREKRLLFESLCRRAGTKFNSSDNIDKMCEPNSLSEQPRTQSLHDLSKYKNNHVAVKEICRYFEQRGGSRGEVVTRSPSPECKINPSTFTNRRQLQRAEKKLGRLKQNITEAEGNIWRLQDQSNKLDQSSRSESLRIQKTVKARMSEEKDRLKKFQEEMFKIQREIDIASDQFGIAATKVRHHSNVR